MANLRGQKKFVSIVPPGLRLVERSVLPGFKLTMGLTVTYLSLVVLIPLSGLFLATRHLTFGDFCHIMQNDLVAKSFKLTFGASLCAALVNAVMGFIVAWVLVRYRFVGRRLLDMMVDLPFALPTAGSLSTWAEAARTELPKIIPAAASPRFTESSIDKIALLFIFIFS